MWLPGPLPALPAGLVRSSWACRSGVGLSAGGLSGIRARTPACSPLLLSSALDPRPKGRTPRTGVERAAGLSMLALSPWQRRETIANETCKKKSYFKLGIEADFSVPPTPRQILVCVVYGCYYRYKILEEHRMSPEHS